MPPSPCARFNLALQDKQSEQLSAAYQFAGWLMGQCVLNRAPLCFPLSPLLFTILLQGASFAPDLATLEQFDPSAAASVRNVAALPPAALRDMLTLEGLPPGMTAAQYAAHAARDLLLTSVQWQSRAVAAGFAQCLDPRLLAKWCLGPRSLAGVVAGAGPGSGALDDDIPDLRTVFRVMMDDELAEGGSSATMGRLLWQVLGSWPAAKKRRFLEFVTGSERLPAPGTELLKVESPFVAMGMVEHRQQLGMLPQAHTCDNLLELPNYWESLLQVGGRGRGSKCGGGMLGRPGVSGCVCVVGKAGYG